MKSNIRCKKQKFRFISLWAFKIYYINWIYKLLLLDQHICFSTRFFLQKGNDSLSCFKKIALCNNVHSRGQTTVIGAFIWAKAQRTFLGCSGWTAFDYKGCCFINFSANAFLLLLLFHQQRTFFVSPLWKSIAIYCPRLSILMPYSSHRMAWTETRQVSQTSHVEWLQDQMKNVTTNCIYVFLWTSLLRGQVGCKCCLAFLFLRPVNCVFQLDRWTQTWRGSWICQSSPAAVTADI